MFVLTCFVDVGALPYTQVIDTVELYNLPNQRWLSLKFLATHVLGVDVQIENHDAIEDARTALALYHRYLELEQEGIVDDVLRDLYSKRR
jgi:PAB-dependent poly(A)-specific ribonuclease subunit 2